MNLRILSRADFGAVAAIHRAAFPRAAVSRLGAAAARRYYESLASGPHGTVGLGAFEDDRLLGFSFVGVRHIAEGSYVRRNALFLAWRIATHPQLLAESFIWQRIGSGLSFFWPKFRPRAAPGPAEPNAGQSYGIQYLAVDPACQSRGLGRLLLGASEDLARRNGCAEIHLSVYLDNGRAIALYERMGWQKVPQGGVWLGLMCKPLAAAVETSAHGGPVGVSP